MTGGAQLRGTDRKDTIMQNNTRIGHRMATILITLAAMGGTAPSKLALEPDTDTVHTWHYDALGRLERRGLVEFVPPTAGNKIAVRLTAAGERAYDEL